MRRNAELRANNRRHWLQPLWICNIIQNIVIIGTTGRSWL